MLLGTSPNERISSTPQQKERRGRRELYLGDSCQVVTEERPNVMGMIQELNSRFHKLSEQTNARQQQVLEELNATLKEQARAYSSRRQIGGF